MAKNYIIKFGQTLITGLSPTFTIFKVVPGGGSTTPPGVTELPTSSGLYYFSYEPSASIAFTIDGATTALITTSRFISGALDPVQAVDERITELGASLNALSASFGAQSASFGFGSSLVALIGTTASSFGSTLTDPSTVMGYLKRLQEFNEGNSIFTKTSGAWSIYSRGNAVGASTQLAQKTVSDAGSVITKA